MERGGEIAGAGETDGEGETTVERRREGERSVGERRRRGGRRRVKAECTSEGESATGLGRFRTWQSSAAQKRHPAPTPPFRERTPPSLTLPPPHFSLLLGFSRRPTSSSPLPPTKRAEHLSARARARVYTYPLPRFYPHPPLSLAT